MEVVVIRDLDVQMLAGREEIEEDELQMCIFEGFRCS